MRHLHDHKNKNNNNVQKNTNTTKTHAEKKINYIFNRQKILQKTLITQWQRTNPANPTQLHVCMVISNQPSKSLSSPTMLCFGSVVFCMMKTVASPQLILYISYSSTANSMDGRRFVRVMKNEPFRIPFAMRATNNSCNYYHNN